MPVAHRLSADEYLAMPLEDRRTQLIDGEIVVTEPRPLHQAVLFDLLRAIDEWTRGGAGRGRVWLPLDVRIDDSNVYAPDLLWYGEGRGPGRHDDRPSPLPDLIAEVRSPSTWRYDIGAKKAGYERRGLPEVWLVDTAADEVIVFRRSAPAAPSFDVALELGRDATLTSPLLPGFALALHSLFQQSN